jgi:pyruvate/2-oxoglutarate dehydrogenase complex dihydrolipoamide acyltransferase (E2) component
MRYLLFNLLVVGALAFLLFDGDPPTSVRGAVDEIAVKADRLVEKGKALVGRTEQERPAEPTAQVERAPIAEPEPKPAASAAAKPPASAPPPPAKPRKAAGAPARTLDPYVARRRAEVLGEATGDGATDTTVATEFMAPRVRRGELHKLAEDMELMFVEKVSR